MADPYNKPIDTGIVREVLNGGVVTATICPPWLHSIPFISVLYACPFSWEFGSFLVMYTTVNFRQYLRGKK